MRQKPRSPSRHQSSTSELAPARGAAPAREIVPEVPRGSPEEQPAAAISWTLPA